jgi:hypothetical protein
MQTSLENHILPSAWKIASVTPIFKKGDKFCAENYRPISLTSAVCKVMETIVSEDLSKYRVSQKWRTNYLLPYPGCLNVHEKNMEKIFQTKK